VIVAAAGLWRIGQSAAQDADASALQHALLTARFAAFAAERTDLREVARLQKLAETLAGGPVLDVALVTEAADPSFPLLRTKRYLVHSDAAKASLALAEAKPADAAALEASRRVMDRAEAGKPYVRADFRGGSVSAGVAVNSQGAPAAAALATVGRAPRQQVLPVRTFTAAAVLAIALYAAFVIFLPAIRHAAAALALAMLAAFSLSGREVTAWLDLSRLAERAQTIAAYHDLISSSPEGEPPIGPFLSRMQAGDPRPFIRMSRNDAPFNGRAPAVQLRDGDTFTVPVEGLRASYTFSFAPGTAEAATRAGRDAYAAGTGWVLLAAVIAYAAIALPFARRRATSRETAP
jgi:hypothetical protein